MTGDRVNLTFCISLDDTHRDFQEAVISEACHLAGGCTVTYGQGYWIEGAEQPQFTYDGHVEAECVVRIEMLLYEHAEMRVYESMRSCIAGIARRFNVPINWVHVVRVQVKAMHFNVDEVW